MTSVFQKETLRPADGKEFVHTMSELGPRPGPDSPAGAVASTAPPVPVLSRSCPGPARSSRSSEAAECSRSRNLALLQKFLLGAGSTGWRGCLLLCFPSPTRACYMLT